MATDPRSAGSRGSRGRRRAATGFTLIELIVAIALIAILLSLAVPSFVRFQRSAELTSTANNFMASLAAARAEAMRYNHDTYVVPTAGGTWESGWRVYVDMNKNRVEDAGDVLIAEEPQLPALIKIPAVTGVNAFKDGTETYVLFNGSGFPRLRNNAFQPSSSVEFASGTELRRRVLLSPAGRMRVCKPDTDTGCDQAAL